MHLPLIGADVDETNQTLAWISAIAYNITALFMIIFAIFHSVFVYQDLYTEKRESVAWRKKKPKPTLLYGLINVLTLFSIYFYTASSISGVANHFSQTKDECNVRIILVIVFIQTAKSFMYLVFLARMYRIYCTSPLGYPRTCISFFVFTTITYNIIVVLVTIFTVAEDVVLYSAGYPSWCKVQEGHEYAICGGMILLQDIVGCIGFYWVFTVPLRRTIKAYKAGAVQGITKKIMYFGAKTTILACTATTCTVIIIVMTAVLSGVFSIPLPIINSLALAFMTSYYPDQKYYLNICWCFIKCCDRDGVNTKMISETINEQGLTESNFAVDSIDTHSQLRFAVKNLQISYEKDDNNNDTCQVSKDKTNEKAATELVEAQADVKEENP
eukprot:437295_1